MPRGFRSNADMEAYYTGIEVDDIIPAGCRFGMSFDPDCVDRSCIDVRYNLSFDSTPGGANDDGTGSRNRARTWDTNRMFSDYVTQGPRGESRSSPDTENPSMKEGTNYPGYYKYDWVQWEHAINMAIVQVKLENADDRDRARAVMTKVSMNRFPYPQWTKDGFLFAIEFGLPMLMMLALMFTALSITVVSHERPPEGTHRRMCARRPRGFFSSQRASFFCLSGAA